MHIQTIGLTPTRRLWRSTIKADPYPSLSTKDELAGDLGLSRSQVQIWLTLTLTLTLTPNP